MEENFRTPSKDKVILCEEENSQKKCFSESGAKFLKNKLTLGAKTNTNQGCYRFDLIIDSQYQNFYFQEDSIKKLYFELEVGLKGSFLRNWDSLAKGVSFNSMDYDFFLNMKNSLLEVRRRGADDELVRSLKEERKKRIEIEDSECENFSSSKEKRQYVQKHLIDNYSMQNSKKNKGMLQLPAVIIFSIIILNVFRLIFSLLEIKTEDFFLGF